MALTGMQPPLSEVIELADHPLHDPAFRAECKRELDDDGVLLRRGFLKPAALASIRREAEANRHVAYYTASKHNIHLSVRDPAYPEDHPRNREIVSSKGCITTDQIPAQSALHVLYRSCEFRDFLCAVLDEHVLHEFADPLSSINLNYADEGQELGWHFDDSPFAVTLMIQRPERGGAFEYVKNVRDADSGEVNYELCRKILDGEVTTSTLATQDGALVLFRGRNSLHRVTPVIGERTRVLVVLAYSTRPGVSLSRSARMTFFGRLG